MLRNFYNCLNAQRFNLLSTIISRSLLPKLRLDSENRLLQTAGDDAAGLKHCNDFQFNLHSQNMETCGET